MEKIDLLKISKAVINSVTYETYGQLFTNGYIIDEKLTLIINISPNSSICTIVLLYKLNNGTNSFTIKKQEISSIEIKELIENKKMELILDTINKKYNLSSDISFPQAPEELQNR